MKNIFALWMALAVLHLMLTVSRADGTITEVNVVKSGLELKTWMVIGNKYQLQCSTNLVEGSWEDLGEQINAVMTVSNLYVHTEAEQCWFRVVEEQGDAAGPTSPPKPPGNLPF
ncbi:hypothetical protein [Pontiella agarivorans]|uniref:Uncharacterized protein n=1 Tax=Pontiella agarivorans TaxID=3038953 RepID=A0ABU5MXD1_9BACT|nr:hypothetical protein [Pontiella agarivorans]MDZ8118741.1 hypothetical protein [Pontiella agarivorans]